MHFTPKIHIFSLFLADHFLFNKEKIIGKFATNISLIKLHCVVFSTVFSSVLSWPENNTHSNNENLQCLRSST
jgi:hypothetical protein